MGKLPASFYPIRKKNSNGFLPHAVRKVLFLYSAYFFFFLTFVISAWFVNSWRKKFSSCRFESCIKWRQTKPPQLYQMVVKQSAQWREKNITFWWKIIWKIVYVETQRDMKEFWEFSRWNIDSKNGRVYLLEKLERGGKRERSRKVCK